MPNAKTYGDLKKDVDTLLSRMDRVRGDLDRRRGQLEDLKLRIASAPDDAALDDVYGGESTRLGKVSDALSSIETPEALWSC